MGPEGAKPEEIQPREVPYTQIPRPPDPDTALDTPLFPDSSREQELLQLDPRDELSSLIRSFKEIQHRSQIMMGRFDSLMGVVYGAVGAHMIATSTPLLGGIWMAGAAIFLRTAYKHFMKARAIAADLAASDDVEKLEA